MSLVAILAVFGLMVGILVQQEDKAAGVPSAVLHHGASLPASLDQYAQPGNVIIVTAQQRIRNPARLRAWRAKGAIVMAYVNLVDHHEPWGDSIEDTLYGGSFPSEWFYYDANGNRVVNWGSSHMLNLESTSPIATYNGFRGTWGEYAARWIRDRVIVDGQLFNGVMLDVWGHRIWNVGVGGPGTAWEAGIAKWGQEIRRLVGPDVYLIGNNTQTRRTAAPLNGRMWESFTTRPVGGGWNQLDGPNDGLVQTFAWPDWQKPQLDILWRNEASPSAETKKMLVDAANRVTKTRSDIAVGSSDHQGGFPAPFGGGGGVAPTAPTIPGSPSSGGGTGVGGAGATNPSVAGSPVLWSTSFATGRSGWALERGPASSARQSSSGMRLTAGRPAASRSVLWRNVSPQGDVQVDARVRVAARGLPRGGARAVISVAASGGLRREAGPLRTGEGNLRWAVWVRRADGRRTDVRVSRSGVGTGWLRVRLTTGWRAAGRTDGLAVGSATVLRAPAGALAGRRATRIGVGVGQAGRTAPASLLVRSVRVLAR